MKIEELVGSLQTCELRLPQSKKVKSVALKTIAYTSNISNDSPNVDDDVALFVRNFRKAFRFNKGNKWRKQPSSFKISQKPSWNSKDKKR